MNCVKLINAEYYLTLKVIWKHFIPICTFPSFIHLCIIQFYLNSNLKYLHTKTPWTEQYNPYDHICENWELPIIKDQHLLSPLHDSSSAYPVTSYETVIPVTASSE
jgi:hypothetical protein